MTEDFEEWASHSKYRLDKEQYKPEVFANAWIYKSTHTQSAWEAWDSACLLYTGISPDILSKSVVPQNGEEDERVSEVKSRKRKVSPV